MNHVSVERQNARCVAEAYDLVRDDCDKIKTVVVYGNPIQLTILKIQGIRGKDNEYRNNRLLRNDFRTACGLLERAHARRQYIQGWAG